MSADVSENLKEKTADTSELDSSEIVDDDSPNVEDDSDEFTDWSEDDDNSQNLDDDMESNFSEKRYSGDGEEQPSGSGDRIQKRVDDDEDRKNPAYVPRKGSFFEHDLRRGSDDRCQDYKVNVGLRKVKNERPIEQRRRGLWSCDRSRWEHDRFDEMSQRPKSVHELVTIYGFNIRKDARTTSSSKRYGMRSKMRGYLHVRNPILNGTPTKRSPSVLPRKVGKHKKDSLRTFIIVRNDEKDNGDEVENETGCPNSGKSETAEPNEFATSCSLDFDNIKGTNRFIEEPIICFAPKRGEKVDAPAPVVQEAPEERQVPCSDKNEENKSENSEVMSYSGEFIFTPGVFRRGGNYGVAKKKKFFAGSGRIAPVLNSRGRRFPRYDQGRRQNEDVDYSSDEVSFNVTSTNSVEKSWRSFPPPVRDSTPEDRYFGYRGPSPQYRGKNKFRGRFRGGRPRNYYDGTFPQDVRLIVMCGDGGNASNEANDRREALSSSVTIRNSSAEKSTLVTSQGGFIPDILPPVTCCARTRTARSSADSVVYSVAKTEAASFSTTSVTSTTSNSDKAENARGDFGRVVDEQGNGNNNQQKEGQMAGGQKFDPFVEEKMQNDRRYSAQRNGNDGRARNKSAFNPRFPAPPRNRIFHPNAFNNPASSFLPAAFLLPTGPLFPGSQRHPSGPHIPSNMGRNNASILGLNSHHNPSHPPSLLALPVRVTPVPFILASSQALSLSSSQHLPPPTPSPPRLHSSSASGQLTPSSNATPASPSSIGAQSSPSPAAPNSSTPSSSSSASALVSRPTSLFQAGPQRSTPHPKHWFRFNSKHCALLKPFPAFQHHQHQMQFRQAFNNFGNVNKSFVPPSSSTMQPGKNVTRSLPVTTTGTSSALPSSSTSVMSVPLSSSVVSSSPKLTAGLVAASKLSPHAAAFKSSIQSEVKPSEAQDVQSNSGIATLYEITPAQSRYWQRSHKACPIEVRGGTVYFSPELQKFQYKCHSSGSKKWQGNDVYSFSDASIVYFDGDGKIAEEGKKGRDKKLLSIVDPKTMQGNESEDLPAATTSESFAATSTTEPLPFEPAVAAVEAVPTVAADENGSAVDDASTNKPIETVPDATQDSNDGSDKDKDQQ